MAGALHSAKSADWYSPELIVEPARIALGGRIAFDPASSWLGNQVVRADQYVQLALTPRDYQNQRTKDPQRIIGDGLAIDWSGPCFVNPPGRCKLNPGGQAAWWKKAVDEWERSRGAFSIVFVGFSLELQQTAQRYGGPQPGHFPHCIPERRIRFDLDADEEADRVRAELFNRGLPERGNRRDEKLFKRLDECAAHRGGRVPGRAPTHGSIIVCMPHDGATHDRFVEAFSKLGFTKGYDR